MQYSTDCVVKCCEDLHRKLGIGLHFLNQWAPEIYLVNDSLKNFVPYIKQAVERMNKFKGSTGIHICGHTRIAGKKLLAQESVDFGR